MIFINTIKNSICLFISSIETGDLMSRISEDVSQTRMYIGPAIMYTINLSILIIVVVFNMFRIDTKLTLYTLISLPILSYSIYKVNNKINIKSQKIQKHLSYLSSYVQECFSGIRVIKSCGIEVGTFDKFERITNEHKNKNLSLSKTHALFFPLMILLIGISNIFVVYIGGIRVMEGHITTGVIAEFVIYINMLTWPITSIGWVTSIVQRAAASQTRINEFLNVRPKIVNHNTESLHLEGNIKFKNVTFKYEDTGIEALKQVSFEVKKSSMLGIIGKIGSGKSTIAELLCRFYDVTSGNILIDGKDIKNINLDDFRQSIGYIPQDTFLFSDTIKNNISFGVNKVTIDQIKNIVNKVLLFDTIYNFAKGYDTVIGERGITLSGGQKQRISIGRSILKDPKILILDDCLSSLDTETENTILKNIRTIIQEECTTIIISHRISSVRYSDEIIVLDNGEIIERGTHSKLINKKGYYANLYRKQNDKT